MDSVVSSAIEEICAEGGGGVNLHKLWSLLHPSLAAHGLPLCPTVKAAVWSNLLSFPGLQFHVQGSPYHPQDSTIQSVENCEAMDLKIVASERMLNDFLGMYDVEVSSSSVNDIQRSLLERLAFARHNGMTQNELAKELKIRGNDIFYKLKKLEVRGLIVRQSTVVKTKELCGEGEYKNSNVATNMVYLYRYAKHLGCQQRIEIVRKEKAIVDEFDNGEDDAFCQEHIAEEVKVKDFIPALEAVCEKLEKAPGKVLVVSDIKKDLGYRGTSGHRVWRRILGKLKAAQLVEDCDTKDRDKVVKCLRLLKKFSRNHFEPNLYAHKNDNPETEQPQSGKRAQITDELLELPIEHQIYDMIHIEGCRGLTIVEICKRLGLPTKKIHDCLYDMETRFGLHLQAESKNRGKVYRVWTPGNYSSEGRDLVSCTVETMSHETTDCDPSPVVWEADQVHDLHVITSKDVKSVDSATMEEVSLVSVAKEDENLMLHPLITVDDASTKLRKENTTTDTAQPETSCALSLPSKRRCQSNKKYPCLESAASSLREQRILKMLEEERILIKPELHRRLETLENLEKEKHSMMDRKTLQRNLATLQKEGRCKVIMLTIPVITNCGRNRSTEVVLHPSILNMSPEVLCQIQEKLRSFEIQTRRQSHSRSKEISGPLLDNVERISANVQSRNQAEQSEVKCANGFVLAKMVRTKLLHIFLWSHISSSPCTDDLLSIEEYRCNMKNPHSTSKLFGLDAAIKAMPLELFLQVVGSNQKIEDMVEKCKNGLRLADLKVQEYKFLMDTGATARLSKLIDTLLRLKLVRLVRTGYADDEEKIGNTTLRHAMELKPYIEEPVSVVPSSFGFIFPDLRPHIRHDFILSSRKAVDEYWSTLEYCYAAANSKAALHAFPGSAVHEIFMPRSWASARVMTADQRAQLLKRLALNHPHKKLSLNECREISRDLNLTLEQVVRIYYHKRQQCSRLSEESVIELPKHQRHSSRKRKKSIARNSVKDVNFASEEGTLSDHQPASLSVNNAQLTDRQRSFLKTLGDHEISLLQDLSCDQFQGMEEQESNEDSDDDQFRIHDCTLSTVKPGRKRRFYWTEEAERQLVIEYARHRASVGAKLNRTDWTLLTNLPASPNVCKRRMAALNGNLEFRRAVMRLCNMLAERYTKELKKFQKHLSNFESTRVLACEPKMQGVSDQSDDHNFEHNVEAELETCWDDFEDSSIKVVLDNALRLIRATKNSSNLVGSDEWFGGHLWAWERMPPLAPTPLDAPPPQFLHAYGDKWAGRLDKKKSSRHVISAHRDQISGVTPDQFRWEPYTADVLARLPAYCVAGHQIWRARTMMICFNIVEPHYPDRVLRQFGFEQRVPTQVLPTLAEYNALHSVGRSGRHNHDWRLHHRSHVQAWEDRAQSIVQAPPRSTPVGCDGDYMGWYVRRTVVYIDMPGRGQSQEYGFRGNATRASVLEIHGVEGAPSVHASPGDEFAGHRSKLPARRSRSRRIARKFNRLLNEGTRISRRVYESVAVSNAAELFKLIFLSTSINAKASQLLAETLRRYSQHDLFAAFSYLRENKIVIGGEGTSQFALSQQFLQNLSLSPFPTNTGKRALRIASWLAERERNLMEGEVYLSKDLHCGDIFHLCALISNTELSISPCLPEVGIGEVEDSRASKRLLDGSEYCDGEKSKRVRTSTASQGEIISRREKGFPGIRLSLSLAVVPRECTLDMFKDNDNSGASLFLEKCQDYSTGLRVRSESSRSDTCNSAGVIVDNLLINQTSAPAHQSPWEDMTSYAEHLMPSIPKEGSSVFHPQLFRSICSAIQESGDQGLRYTEFSKALNLPGQKESEIVMDVLEVFGRAFKVSAYDSVHVVDTLYRSKYFLASVAEADQIPNTNPPVHSQGKMDCGDDMSNRPDEMRLDSDDVHRVTILNRPEELISPLSDNKTSSELIGGTHSGLSIGENPSVKSVEFHAYGSHVSRPLLAWINGDGTINELVYKGLVRRILGIVMQNPGILEDDIIRQMKALNPQSCRKLLEKLILDNHIIVRKMHQANRAQPPSILSSILGSCSKKPKLIAREHLFANPMCTAFL